MVCNLDKLQVLYNAKNDTSIFKFASNIRTIEYAPAHECSAHNGT